MQTTSQLMVYLEPVTMKTPFGPAKPAWKKARRRDIYAECRQICGCRLQQRSSGGSEVRSSHASELPAALEAHGSDATICQRRPSWPARCYTRRIRTFSVIRVFSISVGVKVWKPSWVQIQHHNTFNVPNMSKIRHISAKCWFISI